MDSNLKMKVENMENNLEKQIWHIMENKMI